jgi:alcohol dehydrogenase class IV
MKRLLHDLAVALAGFFMKLLPDKIPVTFVGPQAARELCESIAHTCSEKVLVVTDATLVEIGLIDRITDSLDAVGLRWSVYSGVEPDPTFAQVEAGAAQLEREGCKVILAVGGGSSMDASKVIAAMATNPGPLSKLEGMMKIKRAPMPLFAIPTTAGTGSEVTLVAVISDSETHTKKFFTDPKLIPLMTALDPSLMTGLPAPITAATGMDALTHAVESFLSRMSTETTEMYAKISVRLVFDHLHTACSDGNNLEARKAMALASYYGGLAFTRTSIGYVHAIAHTFGAYYRTPHGLANAVVLPHVLEFSKGSAEGRLARLAEVIGCEGTSDRGSDREKADRFIDAVRDLMAKIDITPKLDALVATDIAPIARQALGEAHLNYPVPRYMSQTQCEDLLRQMIV